MVAVLAILIGATILGLVLSTINATLIKIAAAVLVTSLSFSFLFYLNFSYFAPDARTYDEQAQEVLSSWLGETSVQPSLYSGKEGWPNLLAMVYAIGGPSPYLGLAINAGFCVGIAVLVWKITELICDYPLAPRVAALLVLNPVVIFWGGLLLREAGMWFFVLLATFGTARAVTQKRWHGSGAALILGLAGAFAFRSSVAIPLGLALLVMILLYGRANFLGKLVVVLIAVAFTPFALNYMEQSSIADLERITASQAELASADSGFSIGGIEGMAAAIPRVVAGPFPWEIPSLGIQYVSDWAVWFGVLVFSIVGSRGIKAAWLLWVPALAVLVALVITSGNYGTMIRLRATALVLLLPLAGIGVAICFQSFQSSFSRTSAKTTALR